MEFRKLLDMPDDLVSAEQPVLLLALMWCGIYGLLLIIVRYKLQSMIRAYPLSYPESLVSKAASFANNGTSIVNAFICCVAGGTCMYLLSSSASSVQIEGPIPEKLFFFFWSFMGFLLYDIVYELVLCDHALDWPIIAHHFVYLLVSATLYADSSMVLLTGVLVSQEVSTLFLNCMQIMRSVNQTEGMFYTVNAIALTVTFFVFRLIGPAIALGQLFLYSPGGFLHGKRIFLLTLVSLGYCMQAFWFGKILKGMIKHIWSENVQEEIAPLLDPDLAAGGITDNQTQKQTTF